MGSHKASHMTYTYYDGIQGATHDVMHDVTYDGVHDVTHDVIYDGLTLICSDTSSTRRETTSIYIHT